VTLAERHALLALFLGEPAVEAAVRADPVAYATSTGADLDFVTRLAAIEPRRVRAFRQSRAHKDALRSGTPPRRLTP
jgi:hypothetical protein